MDKEIQIFPFDRKNIADVKAFTDEWIGRGYYSGDDLLRALELSYSADGDCCSFLAYEGSKLVAVRLTYAPGKWEEDIIRGLTPSKWQAEFSHLAYFKSLFVHVDKQAQGLGRELSRRSIDVVKKMGARAILCHCWLESPQDSSRQYLQKMGFIEVAQHPEFWKPVDYMCTRCAPDRCICTASEMIYYIPGVSS